MVKHKTFLYLLLIFLMPFFGFGQSEIDTLKNKTLKELFYFHEKAEKKEEKIKFIKAFVNVAKKQKEKQKIIAGYYILSYLYDDTKALIYSDSIISLTFKNSTKYYPALAYRSKALFYHKTGDFQRAINNYIKVNNFAKKHNNNSLLIDTKYSIGTLKRKIGEYREALKLYKEAIPFIPKETEDYLNHLKVISNVYIELKKPDSASIYNRLGVKKSLKLNKMKSYHGFCANEGITHFLKKNYTIAVDSLEKHRVYYEDTHDSKNLSYYLFLFSEVF